ncbi:hypothetical protein Q9189_006114 [Teloschistes chrysophthalmus]
MFGQLSTVFVALLCAFSGVIAADPTWVVKGMGGKDLTLPSINTTVSGPRYKIPNTDLSLEVSRSLNPLDATDNLVLLAHSLYSAAERDHKGGPSARLPIDIYQFQYKTAQLQMEGIEDRLTSWKAAQIFYGLVVYGARVGFRHSSLLVSEDKIGYIAQVDIV